MRKRLFIFDLDGTLINAYPAIVSSFNFTMRTLGYPPQDRHVIKQRVGWGDVVLLKSFVAPSDLKKAIKIYRHHHEDSLKASARLMPYAYRILSLLAREGIKIAVATNRPTRFTRLLLKHLKINHFFAKVLCTDRLKFTKPNPLVLNKLIREIRIFKSEAIYVGDMVLDIQTAHRAGMDVLAVGTGSSCVADLRKGEPTYLVKDLREMFKLCHEELFYKTYEEKRRFR